MAGRKCHSGASVRQQRTAYLPFGGGACRVCDSMIMSGHKASI